MRAILLNASERNLCSVNGISALTSECDRNKPAQFDIQLICGTVGRQRKTVHIPSMDQMALIVGDITPAAKQTEKHARHRIILVDS